MENEILGIKAPLKKIYKDSAIQFATFLGGPLVAGYLIAENYKVFNEQQKVKTTWRITLIATIIIYGCVLIIPGVEHVPRLIIPLAYAFISGYLVRHYQGAQINLHLSEGGKFHNTWRAIGIGLIAAFITVILFISLLFLTDFNRDYF